MQGFTIRGWYFNTPAWGWLALRTPANWRSVSGFGFSRPCGAISTRGIALFFPGLSELYMYEIISDLGIGSNSPRVRRDLYVSSRGSSRRALDAPPLDEGGGGGEGGLAIEIEARRTLDWKSFAVYTSAKTVQGIYRSISQPVGPPYQTAVVMQHPASGVHHTVHTTEVASTNVPGMNYSPSPLSPSPSPLPPPPPPLPPLLVPERAMPMSDAAPPAPNTPPAYALTLAS